MTTFLPKTILDDLAQADRKKQRKSARYEIAFGDTRYPVLRIWKNGFALDADETPALRGHVDLFQGPVLLMRCLIVASEVEGSELVVEFKRATAVTDKAPLDFERAADAPVALIEYYA